MNESHELSARLQAGEVRALARAISWVESGHRASAELLRELYPRSGRALTLGVTGFPGAGKSSLCDRLIEAYRGRSRSVGVIAVDPSSAFSGGAILGDRIRMMRHSADKDVFIRSMATRGNLGGLSRATADALDLIDAFGKQIAIVETVGVGQDEVEIAKLADVVLVVLVPGLGDDIQAIKAGILEIADIFVINKADRDGADKLAGELRQMMALVEGGAKHPAIVPTVATTGQGIAELLQAIDATVSDSNFDATRLTRQRQRSEARLLELLTRTLLERTLNRGGDSSDWEQLVSRVAQRQLDPYSAVEQILDAAQQVERKRT